MSPDVDLSGRTILVCGVARGGIGGATVRHVVRAGGAVIALDKDRAVIDPAITDVEELGGRWPSRRSGNRPMATSTSPVR